MVTHENELNLLKSQAQLPWASGWVGGVQVFLFLANRIPLVLMPMDQGRHFEEQDFTWSRRFSTLPGSQSLESLGTPIGAASDRCLMRPVRMVYAGTEINIHSLPDIDIGRPKSRSNCPWNLAWAKSIEKRMSSKQLWAFPFLVIPGF